MRWTASGCRRPLAYKCDRIREAIDDGRNDLYLPFHAHHGRGTYAPDKIAQFNERNWGIGYGRSVIDSHGDWHGLYLMAFQDSHYKSEPLGGYAYQTYWGAKNSVQAGLGYTVFLTARSDIGRYTPVPGILPLASLRYRKASLMLADIPRVPSRKGVGDVLFFFGRVEF